MVLKFLMVYFLWTGVFSTTSSAFGYSQSQISTYIFAILIISSFVTSSVSEQIGSEIASGDISNYLLKPVSYLKYWFTRDIANKALNTLFSIIEVSGLWIILKPQFEVPFNMVNMSFFVMMLLIAAVMYFFLLSLVRFIAFWSPDNAWPITFLFVVIMDLLSGGIFPLDILPQNLQQIIQFTPFPYIVYFPATFFIGKFGVVEMVRIMIQSLIMLGFVFMANRIVWKQGLKNYASEGK